MTDNLLDWDTYLRFALALVFVLALLGLLSWLLRRYGWGGGGGGGGRPRRVGIVEITPLDPRRRLVLVRRDDVEHLLLLSTQGDLVVERNIQPASFRHALDATPPPPPQPVAVPARWDDPEKKAPEEKKP